MKYILGINKKVKVNIDKNVKKYIGLSSQIQQKVNTQYTDEKLLVGSLRLILCK